MSKSSAPTCLIVCTGKDCRADKGFAELTRLAGSIDGSREVPCQGLCNGPIVGVQTPHDLRWYSHIRTKAMRALLMRAVADPRDRPNSLRDVEVRKHRGTIRHARKARRLDSTRVKALLH